MPGDDADMVRRLGRIPSSRCQENRRRSGSGTRVLFVLGRIARSGGARRDRTDDLLLAKQALSQLSYGPVQANRNQRSGVDAAAGGRKCVETRGPHPRSR
jgi:hypothetical protein